MAGDVGPIRVSADGRYFVDEAGRPFFWLGDTQWELFRELTLEDADAILANRRQEGFSVIQVMLTGVGDGRRPNLAGETPWANDDPASPNESYFEHADAVIELARQHGLVLVVGVFHQLQTSRITMAKARGYARWVAERYSHAPNLIWTMYPKAQEGYVPVLRELAAGLQEGDGGSHLITVHPDPAPASSSFIHGESWLAFNMIQTCMQFGLICSMVSHDRALTPAKPTVMAEGAYEGVEFGKLQTPLDVRKQAYWSHLAGGHHSYGHNDNWASPATWRAWIDSPGSLHMGVYRDILTSCPEWWTWVPDPTAFASGEGEGLTQNVAARSGRGDWLLAYLSRSTTVSIRMDRVRVRDSVDASWLDPTSGEKTAIDTYPAAGTRSFSTPRGWEDAVLLLEAQGASEA